MNLPIEGPSEYHSPLTNDEIKVKIFKKYRVFKVKLQAGKKYKLIGIQLIGEIKLDIFLRGSFDKKIFLFRMPTLKKKEYAYQYNFLIPFEFGPDQDEDLVIRGEGEFTPVMYEIKSHA